MQYANEQQTIIVVEDGRSVPTDPRNADYQAILASGVKIAPYQPPPPSVPEELSRWQFFAAAAMAGIITQQEAEDAITGPLPTPFVAFITTLPEGQRFAATMLLRGNQVFHRHHQFVQAFLNASGMTAEQADAIWRSGAALA